jgi:hypothetical protein
VLSGAPVPTKPKKASRALNGKLSAGVAAESVAATAAAGSAAAIGQQSSHIHHRGGLGGSRDGAGVEQVHDQIVDTEVGLGRGGSARAQRNSQRRNGGRGQT